MDRITPLPRLPWLSALLIAASLLAGCGGASAPVTPASVANATATPSSPAGTPVELTGTPAASVTAGQNYAFQPTVTQGTGTVTFQIQGKPTWATFNNSTGALTGTPTSANEGTDGGITITGTNGSSSSSIGPFTISVQALPTPPPPITGSVTLVWTTPTQNTDGTPIVGLTGYHIHYGTSASALTTTITITDATQTSYVVSGLAHGTYFFAVDAYDAAGDDSSLSNVGGITI
jgi:hypothetical protein